MMCKNFKKSSSLGGLERNLVLVILIPYEFTKIPYFSKPCVFSDNFVNSLEKNKRQKMGRKLFRLKWLK